MSLNLASLLKESAARAPGRPALLSDDPATRFTHARLHEAASRFAGRLAREGVARGRPVALLLPNVAEFAVAYYGAHYLGAPVVPINTLLTPEEILYHLDDSGAVALVVGPEHETRGRVASSRSAACRLVLETGHEPADEPAELAATAPDDTAVILYTSGTTGRPKGAELTHFNLHRNADTYARILSFDAATVGLCALPLFHSFGQTALLNAVLMRGGALALMRRFEPSAALDLMRRHRVTYFAGVPTMYFGLLHCLPGESRQTGEGGQEAGVPVPGLTTCISGGAPMPVEVMQAFDRRFGVSVRESYGLSETSPVASINHPDRPKKPGSIGTPIEGVEFRLVDDAGLVIETAGTPGEICIKGCNVMKGYHGKPEATSEAIRDGWLRTGDVAVRDADGYYVIVDRRKDMILRGGYSVYPREIEEVLYAHPAVAEAAVIGVPHESLGEEIRAVVVLKPQAAATAEEITAHCRGRLAPYKYPRQVEFRDALPKGPTGKILKKALRGGG